MKRVITITIEGEALSAPRPSGDLELERLWYLEQLSARAREAVEYFHHTVFEKRTAHVEFK